MHVGISCHEYHRGVFSTVGDTILCNLNTVGDIMIHVGDIMSTVGVFSTVRYSNKRFSPHCTEHPPYSRCPPTCIMISPTVLNTCYTQGGFVIKTKHFIMRKV